MTVRGRFVFVIVYYPAASGCVGSRARVISSSEENSDKPFTSKPIDCHCPVSPQDPADFPLSLLLWIGLRPARFQCHQQWSWALSGVNTMVFLQRRIDRWYIGGRVENGLPYPKVIPFRIKRASTRNRNCSLFCGKHYSRKCKIKY